MPGIEMPEPEPEAEAGARPVKQDQDQGQGQGQGQEQERSALKPTPPLTRPGSGSGRSRARTKAVEPEPEPEPMSALAAPGDEEYETLLGVLELDAAEQTADETQGAEQVEAAPLRNAGGCEEKHSRKPQLWNIDGTELDLQGTYKFGGQLWYLQDRALGAIKAGRPIAGFPINQAAAKSGHAFTAQGQEDDGSDEAEEAEESLTLPADGDRVDPYASPSYSGNLYTMMMEAVAKQKGEAADDYLFARRSLYLFGKDSGFRRACLRYHCGLDARVSEDRLTNFRIFFVVASCCTAVVQAEYYHAVGNEEETVRLVSDSVQLGIHALFALDALPRIVAMGFWMDPQAYLRSPRYFVEFVLLILLIPAELHLWGGGVPWSPSTAEGPASTQLLPGQVSWALPFRSLVFIRMTTQVKNLRLLCRTISEAIPQLSLMFIMMGLIMTAASIMGVQLWHGLFRHKCFPMDESVYNGSVFDIRPPFIEFGERTSLCMPRGAYGSTSAGRMCANYHAYCDSPTEPQDGLDTGNHGVGVGCQRMLRMEQTWGPLECRADSSNLFPHEKLLSFDNFGQAMFLVFQIITLSSWSQVMYIVADVDNGIVAVVFFVVVVLFGAYFIQNLTVAILKAKFDTATAKILEELKLEEKIVVHELEFYGANRGKALLQKMRQKVRTLGALGVLQSFMDQKARDGQRIDSEPISKVRWTQARAKVSTVNLLYGGSADARRQQLRAQAADAVADAAYTLGRSNQGPRDGLQNLIFGRNFDKEKQQPDKLERTSSFMARAWKIQVACLSLTDDRRFEKLFILLTMFNTVILAAEFHGQPDWYSSAIEYCNVACTLAFACEMAIRLCAETPRGYMKSAFNVFDGFIVVTSLIDLVVLTSGTGVSSIRSLRIFRMFRVFRVLRVIKLIRYLTDLKNIIVIVIRCIPHVTWVCLLLLTALFTYSLAAMYMYRGLMDFPHGKPRANFDSFFLSVVSMFQVLTLDDWEFIMYDASQAVGNLRPCIFFISWILLGVYILLNVITILILSRFLSHSDEEDQPNTVAETLVTVTSEQTQPAGHDKHSMNVDKLTSLVLATPSLPGSTGRPAEASTADPEAPTGRVPQAQPSANPMELPDIPSVAARRCSAAVIDNKWFDRVVLIAIVMNTVILAMDNPAVDPESSKAKAFEIIDYILTAFFTVEMAIKIHGLTLRGYLKHGWNVVDAIIVVLSDIGVLIQIYVQMFQADENDSNLAIVRTIRVMRVLRPLLLVGHFQGMKLILESVVKSALSIANVLLLLMFVWMIFAIVGMNLFSGKLYYCTDGDIEFRSECVGVFVPEVENPVAPRLAIAQPITPVGGMPEEVSVREWVAHGSTFDNFFEALVTLNEINAFQEWPNTAWIAVDSTDVDHQPYEGNGPYYVLYFMAFIIVSQYMFMNLFIGVIFTSFAQVKAAQSGKDNMTRRQLCWLHISQMIVNSAPIALPQLPQGGRVIGEARRFLYRLVLSNQADLLIQGCIVANVIVLATTHHDMTETMKSNLKALNTAFNLTFMAEAAAKIIALNWSQYWSRGWNRLDFILVALSAVDFIIISNVNAPKMEESFDSRATVRAIGALRVLRVLRLVRKSRQVMQLFQMMKDSAGYFANALLVYLLMLIMFSILAMNLFGTVHRGSYLHDRANFETFWYSMLTLFRAASSDDWNELSYGASAQEPHCQEADGSCGHFWVSRAFFFVFNVIMALVFMNLLAAVFLENFDDIEMKARYRVNTDDIRRFQHCWLYYDPSGTGWVSLRDLPDLLREAGPPIGVPKRATNSEILRLVRSEKLRVPNGMRSPLVGDASVLVKLDEVYYYDMLFSLCWRCCGVAMKSSGLVQETMQMLKNRGMYSVLNEVRRATPPAHCAQFKPLIVCSHLCRAFFSVASLMAKEAPRERLSKLSIGRCRHRKRCSRKLSRSWEEFAAGVHSRGLQAPCKKPTPSSSHARRTACRSWGARTLVLSSHGPPVRKSKHCTNMTTRRKTRNA
eukprot:COSAG03_NODE_476_length_7617_cov_79.083400_1_plen_1988_part_00